MISSTPPTKKQAASAYLRVKTEFESEFDSPISPDRLLTPVSAHSTHRRDSYDDWNYTQSSGSGSHPSSVSSFPSLEPATPPYHGHHSSHLLDMNPYANRNGAEKSNLGSIFSSPLHTPGVSNDAFHFAVTPAADWHGLSYRDNNPSTSISLNYAVNGLPSVSSSFSSTMDDRMLPSIAEPHKSLVIYPVPWSNHSHQLMDPISMASDKFRSSTYPTHSFTHVDADSFHQNMAEAEPWSLSSNDIGLGTSTVMPSQTLMGGNSHMIDHSVPELAFSSPRAEHPRDTASFDSSPYEDDQFGDMMYHEEEYSDQSGSLYSSPTYFETSTGGKSVKKQKRGNAAAKRRSKGSNLGTTYKGRVIKVPMEKSTASKRYACNWPGTDGRVCGKKFQRVEHLKRHRQTHDGDQYYFCPDPECKKIGRAFRCRNDNLREHFKTHLRETTTKRNSSRTFEEIYNFIRSDFPAEDAEKYISKLEKWREERGHLKSDNGTASRRSDKT
jgi:hypothetical protein